MKKSSKVLVAIGVLSIIGVYGLNYYEYSNNANVEQWRERLKMSDLSAFFRYRTYNAEVERWGGQYIYINDKSPEQVLEEYIETCMRTNEVMNHYGYFSAMLHYLGLDYLAATYLHPHKLTLDELNYIYQPLGVKYHVEKINGENIYDMDKKSILNGENSNIIINIDHKIFESDIDIRTNFDYDKFYEKYHTKYPLKNINHNLHLDLSFHGIPYNIYINKHPKTNDGDDLASIRIVNNMKRHIYTILENKTLEEDMRF